MGGGRLWLLRLLPRWAVSLTLVPGRISALTPSWVPPSALGLQSHVENSDCSGASGTPTSRLPPLLLACLCCGLDVHLVSRLGDFSGSSLRLLHFLYYGRVWTLETQKPGNRTPVLSVFFVLFLWSAARPAAPLWGPGRGGRARWGVGWGPKKFWGERHWWVCEHVILPRADKEVSTERLSDRAQVVQQFRGQSGPTQVPDARLHGKPLARASERLSCTLHQVGDGGLERGTHLTGCASQGQARAGSVSVGCRPHGTSCSPQSPGTPQKA